MNRRDFITTASAAAAIPALPAFPLASPAPAAAISSSARYWAVYMTELNGDITPATLAKMAGTTTSNAAAIKADLIAQNVLKPTGFGTTASVAKTAEPHSLLKKAQNALDHLAEPEPETAQEPQELESSDATELGKA